MARKEIIISLSALTIIHSSTLVFSNEDFTSNKKIRYLQRKSESLAQQVELNWVKARTRLNHAKELLGKKYPKSVVKSGETVAILDDNLLQWTHKRLKKQWKNQARKITNAIIHESLKYGFDPVFLMAIIENESSFNPEAIGSQGEIGLMQLMPKTAEWIAQKFEIKWNGADTLKNPVNNIKIGSAYLAFLREKFSNQSQLYVSAYNMGSGKLRKALDRQTIPKEYNTRVMARYFQFYSSLKRDIQNENRQLEASIYTLHPREKRN